MTLGRYAVAAAAALACGVVAAQAPPSAARLTACAACHGERGQSVTPTMPSLAGQPRLFVETQLVLIREGLRDVPAMKPFVQGMTDEEINAFADYFAAQPAKRSPVASKPERARAGAEIAKRLLCGTCHLPTFAGQQQVPRLAGQDEAYLMLSMKQLRDSPGPGRDTIMAATLRGLSDDELASLAHHLAHFSQ
jgi:cytochrome c553